MATVNSLVDAATTEGADLLITLSTPTLQAALKRAAGKPIVFTYLANAVAAGAGRSDEDHLPNVTGVYNTAAYAEMLERFARYARRPGAGNFVCAGGSEHGLPPRSIERGGAKT